MILTDTHCHLDFNRFDDDRTEVIARAQAAGVSRILIPGLTVTSSRAAVKLAESHPMLYAAVGVHPSDSLTWDAQTIPALRELSTSLKVVAVGEIGLDYYRERTPREIQKRALQEQLNLAAELELPVILHLRDVGDTVAGPATSDLMKILEEWGNRSRASSRGSTQGVKKSPLVERPGVLHSFSGSHETAEWAIRLGFYVGVTGPITFKNATRRREVIAALPLESLLIETDAPFLAPVPRRGGRNESAYVKWIAEKIAELHNCSQEEVAAITTLNAARLFSWGETV